MNAAPTPAEIAQCLHSFAVKPEGRAALAGDADQPAIAALWCAGYLRLADWDSRGQRFHITAAGREALQDAQLLDGLGEERPPAGLAGDTAWEVRRAAVQAALAQVDPGPITRGLLALLWLVFVWGWWLAIQDKVAWDDYLWSGRHSPLLMLTAVHKAFLDKGEWYRLGSAALMHIGLQHFCLNAVAIYYVGATTERFFGSWRYLLLLAFTGIAGNLGAILANPNGGAGASGILYGIAAAQLSWLFLHRNYLAPGQWELWRSDLFRMFFVMILMSTGPGFSWGAHLGGGVAGIVGGALLLQFGGRAARWRQLLAALGMIGFLAGGIALLPVIRDLPLQRLFNLR